MFSQNTGLNGIETASETSEREEILIGPELQDKCNIDTESGDESVCRECSANGQCSDVHYFS